jgi:hypothetical protein
MFCDVEKQTNVQTACWTITYELLNIRKIKLLKYQNTFKVLVALNHNMFEFLFYASAYNE